MDNHIKTLHQTLSRLKSTGLDLDNITPQNIKKFFPVLDAIPLIIWITDRITPVYLNTKGRTYYNFSMDQIKREKSGIYAHYLHSDTFHKINIGGKVNDTNPDNNNVSFFKVINGKQEIKWIGNISYQLSKNNKLENRYMLHLSYDADECFGKVGGYLGNNELINEKLPTLKEKEYEVLDLICKEYTSKEIASKLFMSTETVNYHRKSLMDKLKVKSSIGVALKAQEYNLV
ncbi:MAG: LuxR C-terminal-related transcriptional regulator [Chitinophagales bacterium]